MLPGVYTVEAAAQAADILMMTAGRYAGKLPLFMGIERARFRRKILPGDTLEIHVALQEELEKRAIAACRGGSPAAAHYTRTGPPGSIFEPWSPAVR